MSRHGKAKSPEVKYEKAIEKREMDWLKKSKIK